MYNTETAKEIDRASNNLPSSDFQYYEERLYKKKTGEFFLYGDGGAASQYGARCGNTWSGRTEIIPLTVNEAKSWVEENSSTEIYIELFGEVDE